MAKAAIENIFDTQSLLRIYRLVQEACLHDGGGEHQAAPAVRRIGLLGVKRYCAFLRDGRAICPSTRPASNCTLSPTFTCLSIAASMTRNTIVMFSSSISRLLIGPCVSVIFPAPESIFFTTPLTISAWADAADKAKMPSASVAAASLLIFIFFPFVRFACGARYLTTMVPIIPASRWPGIRQEYSNSPGLLNFQNISSVFFGAISLAFGSS